MSATAFNQPPWQRCVSDRQVAEFGLAHAPERGVSKRVHPPLFGLGEVAAI
ncbi:MAG: hypothetical protein ACT6RB_10680 [Neoaquamicrobium sediminum]